MTKAEEILRKEITLFEWGKENDKQLITYEDALKAVNKAINYTHSCTELKTFDIHECINEVTKSANKLSPWIVDARKDRSFRYIIKKAIDKMLYSN